VRYLLDTHTFIWFCVNDKRLSLTAREIIKDSKNCIFLSVISVWEIIIKISIGKLRLKIPLNEFIKKALKEYDFRILNLSLSHVFVLEDLPYFHKDPFDRILVSQAIVEDLIIITQDNFIPKYKVKTIW